MPPKGGGGSKGGGGGKNKGPAFTDEAVAEFCQVTGAGDAQGRRALTATKGNLNAAIDRCEMIFFFRHPRDLTQPYFSSLLTQALRRLRSSAAEARRAVVFAATSRRAGYGDGGNR